MSLVRLGRELLQRVATYGHVGGGSRGHYRKQRDEKPHIVPGNGQSPFAALDPRQWR